MNKRKKVLVTAAGPNMLPILNQYTLPTFQLFADAQGYDVHVEHFAEDDSTRKGDKARQARWQKIALLRRMLKQYEVAVWFDADVMIRRYDDDLASYLGKDDFQAFVLHSVPAERRINPNTGVWVLRSCPEAFDFLDALSTMGLPVGRWADQGAVLKALGWELGDEQYHGARPGLGTPFLLHTAWLPIGWNLPYMLERHNPEAYIGRPMVENPQAIHFMAMTIAERARVMGELSASAVG